MGEWSARIRAADHMRRTQEVESEMLKAAAQCTCRMAAGAAFLLMLLPLLLPLLPLLLPLLPLLLVMVLRTATATADDVDKAKSGAALTRVDRIQDYRHAKKRTDFERVEDYVLHFFKVVCVSWRCLATVLRVAGASACSCCGRKT